MMVKNKRKHIRIRFISVSMLVTFALLIIFQGLLYLHAEKIIILPQLVGKTIDNVFVVIAIFFGASLLLRLTIKRVYNFFDEVEEKLFYSKIYTWSLYSLGVFFILYRFGVSLGNITIFIGLIATGLAFAVRDVLLSFFGWMILLRKKPFRIGDYIRIGEDEGKVMHIGTFYVLVDNTDDLPENFYRVPNRLFLEKSVHILGRNSFHDQVVLQLTDYPDNMDQLLLDLKAGLENLLQETKHLDLYVDIRDGKPCLVVDYQMSFKNRHQVKSSITQLIIKRMKAPVSIGK